MRDVAIIGAGVTKFGELWDKSFRDLGIEAGLDAIADSGTSGREIDALYIGNMSAGRMIGQEHIAPMIAEQIGLASLHIPATRIEAACASGGLALRQAYLAVASGHHDVVIAAGAEKMTDVSTLQVTEALATAADQEWESFFGATYSGLFAMMARRHMHEYGTTREQIAAVSVKNHKNGALNPKAQFQREITLESVINAPMEADPLTVLDSSPVSDGAAALVLCPLDKAKKYTNAPIKIIGSGQATDTLALHNRESITTMKAAVIAAKRAYEQSKKSPGDIDVCEVHDCFTIGEIIATEDLGFFKKGEGGKAVEDGRTSLNGEIPVNTSGGLKARGHPIGATGIAQVVEIVTQLRGKAEKRQIKGANIGLTHNIGGSGGTAVVHIFEVA
ncbi:MAG: thiolase domain-containing protein [Thermoplasmata archaeon]